MNKYSIRYLPLFVEDLEEIIEYIRDELSNSEAANKVLNTVEKAILQRSYNPTSFEVYREILPEKIHITEFMLITILFFML